MDADLILSLEGAAPTPILLVTVTLNSATVRWTDGGFAIWDGQTYESEDAIYGVLGAVGEIEDGADGQATVCDLTILCDQAALLLWIDPAEQGSLVTVHVGSMNRPTGLLIGEPELLFRGELDQPRLGVGPSQSLIYDCITEEARMLEANEEQRLTDSFHQSVWPGELGYDKVTDLEQKVYWRADDPNEAITR
ncbi:MAG: hypothetical protein EON90_02045 [Brevundimonas sp.]|nr:MAG: hypothetical protein EON90_02045 [Brevundimonas sp.]